MATLGIHVVPNAKANSVEGLHGGAIKIKLRAPAIKGKANAVLIQFLAERLRIASRHVTLLRGQKSRDKLVRIEALTEAEIKQRLLYGT